MMMLERREKPQRQTAGEDRVRCRGRTRAAKAQRLRGFRLPGCSSLVEGCALLLLLANISTRELDCLDRLRRIERPERKYQNARARRSRKVSPSTNNTNKPKNLPRKCNTTSRTCTDMHPPFRRTLLLHTPAYHPSRINASRNKADPLLPTTPHRNTAW